MAKLFLLLGSIIMALAVAIGAFGAHGLESRLSERMMKNYQTGVQYHMIHGLGLMATAILAVKMGASGLLQGAAGHSSSGLCCFQVVYTLWP